MPESVGRVLALVREPVCRKVAQNASCDPQSATRGLLRTLRSRRGGWREGALSWRRQQDESGPGRALARRVVRSRSCSAELDAHVRNGRKTRDPEARRVALLRARYRVESAVHPGLFPGMEVYESPRRSGLNEGIGFTAVDHVTSNFQTMKPALLWLERVLGFEPLWV